MFKLALTVVRSLCRRKYRQCKSKCLSYVTSLPDIKLEGDITVVPNIQWTYTYDLDNYKWVGTFVKCSGTVVYKGYRLNGEKINRLPPYEWKMGGAKQIERAYVECKVHNRTQVIVADCLNVLIQCAGPDGCFYSWDPNSLIRECVRGLHEDAKTAILTAFKAYTVRHLCVQYLVGNEWKKVEYIVNTQT